MQEKIIPITVLMSVYNGEKYLKECIESILNQTFRDFEFLIINDASTDSTKDIILSYTDPRIELVENNTNIGLTKSLNKGLKLARGKYVARMDADDISMKERLEKQVLFLENNPEYGAIGSWGHFIDEKGTSLQEIHMAAEFELILAGIFFGNQMMHPSVLMNKDLINEIGGYNENFHKAQDYELWFRVIKQNKKIANLQDFLFKYRSHGENITFLSSKEQNHFSALAAQYGLRTLLGYDVTLNTINTIKKKQNKSVSDKIKAISYLIGLRSKFNTVYYAYPKAISHLDSNIKHLIHSLFDNFIIKKAVTSFVLRGGW